ncbi:glycoside hydrolase family 13 protein [Xylona heveae TC161]|uniref:Glycoside hydrolase family 13 protein n=1 Tax=Xylona heveae (strain CBS 132557 / TC161) TaxID=1328760 RepID=A0A165H5Y5_XYLHT|nr:glycoside hydrolase family 13 protein [Xylona heveae TC161]KZF23032.1 glycoside hydrolase family 13 protein [Xylona heveae TC161]
MQQEIPSTTLSASTPKHPQRAWWKESTVYQIYPTSFKDSNGDGIGDIPGIISKLDYIQALGVDIVWLCPIYKSPQVDMGYDIADYKAIHEPFGKLSDVDDLIAGLHARGIKFLMDLVVNHTSDQHEWFKSAKASKDSPYRNFYIWKKPRYDAQGNRHPPNNWSSYFSGSAWEYDEASDEYYLHLFATEQPDLNWEYPPVRAAVHEIMRFWLDRGVDGFRMDVINLISKDQNFPDAPITIPGNKYQHGSMYYACGPRLHEWLQEVGSILKEYDAFSVGEMPFVGDCTEILRSVGSDRGELNMIFQFEMVDIDHGPSGKFSPRKWPLADMKSIVNKWQTFMYENDGWNALYIENHDQSRTVSRFASDKPQLRTTAAKMLAHFIAFQAGTLFVYQGQELGMKNVPESWPIEEYRDLETLNHWNELLELFPNDIELQKLTRTQYQLKSRDNARTPIQWNASKHAGFTSGQPWMRVNDDYPQVNAEAQVGVKGSVFSHWAEVLQLRKEYKDIFIYGNFRLLTAEDEQVFAYSRAYEGRGAAVVCNFSDTDVKWTPPAETKLVEEAILLSNYTGLHKDSEGRILLRPFESFVCLHSDRYPASKI